MQVERLDERLGLAVCRASLSERTLVTYARDHVAVRTPSRPDFRDGNVLDLLAAPTADEVEQWTSRFDRSVGLLGARTVHLRWELPIEPDAAPPDGAPASAAALTAADAATTSPALDAALARAGLRVQPLMVLLRPADVDGASRLPIPADAAAAGTTLVAVEPPTVTPGGPVDRRWYAATVLYRYVEGDTPDDWRGLDDDFVTWSVDVQRELALAGRAQVWLAMRHAVPVARLTLVHDRQGLAVIEDLVVHPAHRRRGIARALTAAAIRSHLDIHPTARIGIVAEPGSVAQELYEGLGFVAHARIVTAMGSSG